VNASLAERMDADAAAAVERDRAWLPHDRHGRYLVLEAGSGRYLRGEPKIIRQIADAASDRRARRFSSLSRARAFARQVGGTVHRWRRTPPGGGIWRRQSPWDRALKMTRWLPTTMQLPRMEQHTEESLK
jgi:hypothetical protein